LARGSPSRRHTQNTSDELQSRRSEPQ
jgi:hypothetical protein